MLTFRSKNTSLVKTAVEILEEEKPITLRQLSAGRGDVVSSR
jgi:hypothetical protein